MACTYQNYAFDYGTLCLAEPPDHQATVTVTEDVQPQAQQVFPHVPEPYVYASEHTTLFYEQHGMTTVDTCQISAQDAAYRVERMRTMPMSSQISHERLVYINPYESSPTQSACQQPQQPQQQRQQRYQYRRGSARGPPLANFAYNCPETCYMHAPDSSNNVRVPVEMAPHNCHDPMRSPPYNYNSDLVSLQSPSTHPSHPTQVCHHHRLSNHQPPSKLCRTGYSDGAYYAEKHSPVSVVGQPGMPQPAPRPKGPKHKFTPADDTLLLELKETKELTWKQIENFFPGRSSGTLQVRYCTKLKAKSTVWTEDMVSLHPLL
jgi:hypothetical protein